MRPTRSLTTQEPFQAEGFLNYIPLSFLFKLNVPINSTTDISFMPIDGNCHCEVFSRKDNRDGNWIVAIRPPFGTKYELRVGARKLRLNFEFENLRDEANMHIPILKSVWMAGERLSPDPKSPNFTVYLISI